MEMHIGQRLQSLRKQKRLTAKDVADRIGVSRPYLTQLEGGTRRLSVDNLIKIAQVLGVSMSEVFEESTADFQGGVKTFRHIRAINTPAVKQELEPLLGNRTSEFVDCAQMWLKTPRSVRQALRVYYDELKETA